MSDCRQYFEKWAAEPPREFELSRYKETESWPGSYRDYHVQCAWEAWQNRWKISEAQTQGFHTTLYRHVSRIEQLEEENNRLVSALISARKRIPKKDRFGCDVQFIDETLKEFTGATDEEFAILRSHLSK